MKFALVGAGPGNLYVGLSLLKAGNLFSSLEIDVIDRLPTPFGLVRSGVAPDHQDVKNVMVKFNDFLKMPNVRYFGGVKFGTDLRFKDIRKAYHGVILGYGSGLSNSLNLLHYDQKCYNVYTANSIVGWYNGHPDYSNFEPDLSSNTAIIIGNGNVALDIARIFLKDPLDRSSHDCLANTDITSRSLEKLTSSRIRNIHIFGRRSALETSFTTKELRELTKVKGLALIADEQYLQNIISQNKEKLKKDRGKQRLLELLVNNLHKDSKFDKTVHFHFERSPHKVNLDERNRLHGLTFEKNVMIDGRAVGSKQYESMSGGVIITAIGSKGERVDPDIPWDEKRCVVPNIRGRVLDSGGTIPGLFVSGWLKTGPVGTIATTLMSSTETAHSILEDKALLLKNQPSCTIEELLETSRKVPISLEGWNKIDRFEVNSGSRLGKIREKVLNLDQMYSISTNSMI